MKNVVILTDYTDTLFLPKILGPYKVAHELRQMGIQTTVVNHLHMWSFEELLDYINPLINENTLFVGVNNLYYRDVEGIDVYQLDEPASFNKITPGLILPHGVDASVRFRKILEGKNIPVVLGGNTVEDSNVHKNFDYIFQGYTECSLLNFVNHLTNKEPLKNSYRSIHGFTVINDINEQEKYNFTNTTMAWTEEDCVLPGETVNIEIGRGCIFKCAFCSFKLNGKKKLDYIRDFDIIKQEFIDNYERWGITRYYFSDDTFNDSPFKAEMIEQISKQLPFKLEYFAYMRLDLIEKYPETIEKLYNSGLRYTHFGIETINIRSGKAIGKTMTRERVINTLNLIHSIAPDMHLHASFIIGLPGCTEQEILDLHEDIRTRRMPLDSITYFTLGIEYQTAQLSKKISYFSQDFKKYGYEQVDDNDPKFKHLIPSFKKRNPGYMPWISDTMDVFQAQDLCDHVKTDMYKWMRLESATSLHIASLDCDESEWRGKYYNNTDWPMIARRKQERFAEYKKRMWDVRNQTK